MPVLLELFHALIAYGQTQMCNLLVLLLLRLTRSIAPPIVAKFLNPHSDKATTAMLQCWT